MSLIALVEVGIGLILILAILIFFLFQQKKKLKKEKLLEEIIPSFETLLLVIKDTSSTTDKLANSLNTIIEYYGTIDDMDIYSDILYKICTHPHTDTSLILKFDKELRKRNPNYKKEINSAISEGLSLRK